MFLSQEKKPRGGCCLQVIWWPCLLPADGSVQSVSHSPCYYLVATQVTPEARPRWLAQCCDALWLLSARHSSLYLQGVLLKTNGFSSTKKKYSSNTAHFNSSLADKPSSQYPPKRFGLAHRANLCLFLLVEQPMDSFSPQMIHIPEQLHFAQTSASFFQPLLATGSPSTPTVNCIPPRSRVTESQNTLTWEGP